MEALTVLGWIFAVFLLLTVLWSLYAARTMRRIDLLISGLFGLMTLIIAILILLLKLIVNIGVL
jgi:hypothetical protein